MGGRFTIFSNSASSVRPLRAPDLTFSFLPAAFKPDRPKMVNMILRICFGALLFFYVFAYLKVGLLGWVACFRFNMVAPIELVGGRPRDPGSARLVRNGDPRSRTEANWFLWRLDSTLDSSSSEYSILRRLRVRIYWSRRYPHLRLRTLEPRSFPTTTATFEPCYKASHIGRRILRGASSQTQASLSSLERCYFCISNGNGESKSDCAERSQRRTPLATTTWHLFMAHLCIQAIGDAERNGSWTVVQRLGRLVVSGADTAKYCQEVRC